jgi:hypothetical protein
VSGGDAASDAFSLALVLGEVLVGRPARTGSEGEIASVAEDGIAPVPDDLPERPKTLAVRSTALESASRSTAAQWHTGFEGPRSAGTPSGPLVVLLACAVALSLGLGLWQKRAAEAQDRSTVRLSGALATFEGLLLGTDDELDRVDEIGPLAAAGARALGWIEAEGTGG